MHSQEQELHFMLQKTLKQLNLSQEDVIPEKKENWIKLLSKISRCLFDCEQERYLIERSMEISSREMMVLNAKLEVAQRIAHLGYWQYDKEMNKITWAAGTYDLAGIDRSLDEPTPAELMQLVHPNDREKLQVLIRRSFSEGQGQECQIRFKKADGNYNWYYTKWEPSSIINENAKEGVFQFLTGIVMDITTLKINEENMHKMHQQLINLAREAGMAEVAISVLHNVGNILNSANTSILMIQEMMQQPYLKKILLTSKVIKEHLDHNDNYLVDDPKGKKIPDYLISLIEALSNDSHSLLTEINNAAMHLNHIKDIAILQNEFSGISGLKEKISLTDIIDMSIKMSGSETDLRINIEKTYQFNDLIIVDKAKLLQIVINLFRNARESVMSASIENKRISICIVPIDKKHVEIVIEDNGIGIPKEKLTKIFSLGYTTKKHGHGFGLHSSAIAANEIGGSLRVESKGEGCGATFILRLPIEAEAPAHYVLDNDYQMS